MGCCKEVFCEIYNHSTRVTSETFDSDYEELFMDYFDLKKDGDGKYYNGIGWLSMQ